MRRQLQAATLLSPDLEGREIPHLYMKYISAFSLREKISVLDRLFPSERKSRCQTDIFPLKGREKRPTFSLYFLPTFPSSIQNPPCSFSLLLTVFCVTPRYSERFSSVTLPSVLQTSNAVSMLAERSFFLSFESFLLLKFFCQVLFHAGLSSSGFMSSSTPVSSIRCTG